MSFMFQGLSIMGDGRVWRQGAGKKHLGIIIIIIIGFIFATIIS